MVELNHRERSIKVKIVYYGPPVGGKTTNLQVLHGAADARRRGELISINSAQDRTILFDLLPLKAPGFRGFDLRLQLLAVPGQAVYGATRRLVLKGADSLVFVANSARDRLEENLESYREMTHNLLSHHLDPSTMPLVFQYNKRDLPEILTIGELDRSLNTRRSEVVPAVAVRGEGVLETFIAILAETVEDLAKRYAILSVQEGTPIRQWALQAVKDLFGSGGLGTRQEDARSGSPPQPVVVPPPPPPPRAPSIPSRPPAVPQTAVPRRRQPPASVASPAVSPAPVVPAPPAVPLPPTAPLPSSAPVVATPSPAPVVPAPPAVPLPPTAPLPSPPPDAGRLVVRAAPFDEAARARGSFPEGRAIELVESYADASAQLGTAVEELRQERDTARRRLDHLRRTLQAAQEIQAGKPFDETLAPVLSCMAEIAGVEHASFWLPEEGEPPRVAVLHGLTADPLVQRPGALRRVLETASADAPALVITKDDVDLAQALQTPVPPFAAVLAVPFRTPAGLQGLGVLYFQADTARPGVEALEHLAEIARALSASLELVATLQTLKAAEHALELALTGTASLGGLEGMVRSLEELRDRLGEMRDREDAPPWFLEQYRTFAPALGRALDDGRSLLSFSQGEIRRESVLVDDLVADLRASNVTVQLDPAVDAITADATLLRVALRAIADEVRGRAGGNMAPLLIRTAASSDGVSISVQAEARGRSMRATANAGLGMGVARRIAELHGGTIEDAGPEAAEPIVLVVPAA